MIAQISVRSLILLPILGVLAFFALAAEQKIDVPMNKASKNNFLNLPSSMGKFTILRSVNNLFDL